VGGRSIGCDNKYLALRKGKDSEDFDKIDYVRYMEETKKKWYNNEMTIGDLDRSFEYINAEFIKHTKKCNEEKQSVK
jgi:hypothetical protein